MKMIIVKYLNLSKFKCENLMKDSCVINEIFYLCMTGLIKEVIIECFML